MIDAGNAAFNKILEYVCRVRFITSSWELYDDGEQKETSHFKVILRKIEFKYKALVIKILGTNFIFT